MDKNNEIIDLLREILTELKQQAALSEVIAARVSQGIHSPSPSSNTAATGLAEPDNRCTATVSSGPGQEESSPAMSAETLSAMSDESSRNCKEQSSAPAHPLEKPFWESIVSTSRLTSREEVFSLVQEALQAIAKRLAESRLQQCYY